MKKFFSENLPQKLSLFDRISLLPFFIYYIYVSFFILQDLAIQKQIIFHILSSSFVLLGLYLAILKPMRLKNEKNISFSEACWRMDLEIRDKHKKPPLNRKKMLSALSILSILILHLILAFFYSIPIYFIEIVFALGFYRVVISYYKYSNQGPSS